MPISSIHKIDFVEGDARCGRVVVDAASWICSFVVFSSIWRLSSCSIKSVHKSSMDA